MNSAAPCFSATVSEADAKFARAAQQAGARLEFIPHPKPGPSGETLNVGVARLGPGDARKVLLILSGTHGVEGYAGAGIQTALLQAPPALPPDTALLLIHLINPWGPAWNRREDHENIDLFRNFLYSEDPITPDPLYDLIDDHMDLAHFLQRSESENLALQQSLLQRYGQEALIRAIRRGQHHRPQGMTYHGQRACWSKQVLERVLRQQLAGCRQLAVIDLHTGFGAYGAGLVMAYDPPGDARHERIRQWLDGDIYVPGGDFDIPAHSKSPYGFIADWLPQLKVTAAILEFGTYDPEETRDFHLNHVYHLYGDPLSPQGRAIGARYRRYFYPEEPQWRESIWRRGLEVTQKMLQGLQRWPEAAT